MKEPERVLFVDGGAGASGDMILGALVDAGAPLGAMRRALATLSLTGWSLSASRVDREGLAGRRVRVRLSEPHHPRHDHVGRPGAHGHAHRTWRDLQSIVRSGELSPGVRDRALAIFRRLVEAEAAVHGIAPERVHLHEVGATDAVVDVVGACVALEQLEVDRIVVSPLTTGHGTVRCEHGLLPVPAPATALLVRGAPVVAGEASGERLTPTGAAILTTLADAWGQAPPMHLLAVGYGAGERTFPGVPNLLRVMLGEALPAEEEVAAGGGHGGPRVLVLEANVDDATPQALAFACERLFEAGALEVHTTPVLMKKGRAGHALTVLGRPDDLERLSSVLLAETTTLGLRWRLDHRIELDRRRVAVSTPYGTIRVKVGGRGGEELHAWPEYDDCAQAARRHGVPLREVQLAALAAHRAGVPRSGAAAGTGRKATQRRTAPARVRRRRTSA